MVIFSNSWCWLMGFLLCFNLRFCKVSTSATNLVPSWKSVSRFSTLGPPASLRVTLAQFLKVFAWIRIQTWNRMPILNANCSVLARCTIQSSLLKLNAIFQVSTVSENSLKSLDIFKCLKMSLCSKLEQKSFWFGHDHDLSTDRRSSNAFNRQRSKW